MNFHLITLFPESFDSYTASSIIGRAVRNGKIKIKFYNPRDFVKPTEAQKNKEKPYLRIDSTPYGGGVGMVMEAIPVIKAIDKIKRKTKNAKIIWLSPSGKQFDNSYAEKISKKVKDLIIICGRYEGIDERVWKIIKEWKEVKKEKLSIGPYVLTGGELPAMVILDTVARRIPGVLGKIDSVEENRVSSSEVYTRPEIIKYKGKKYRVPKVLLTGHHKKIEEWKRGR